MLPLEIQQPKSILQPFLENMVEALKIYGVVKPLQKMYGNQSYTEKLAEMRNLPSGTIGKEVAQMLDDNNLTLIPKFETHDLKHLVLGYDMTTQDEIKMQAFLFGNGNRSIACLLFLSSGILFPGMWNTYRQEYKKGTLAPSILDLSLDESMALSSEQLKSKYQV